MSRHKNARKNGSQPQKSSLPEKQPVWRWPLGAYKDKLRLVFATQHELEKAVDLLWTDELYTLPHDSPDGKSLVIPAEALDYFTRAGLKFSAEKLRSISDLSPEEIATLRR